MIRRALPFLLLSSLGVAGAPPLPPPAASPADAAASAPAVPEGASATSPRASAEAAPPWAERLRKDADAVLKGEDFRRVERSRGLVMRDWLRRWLQDDDQPSSSMPFDFSFAGIAAVLKWLLVALLAVGVAWLLWRGWQWLSPRVGERASRDTFTPLEARSLALSREELPDRVSSAARAAWHQGDPVLALSLLYRGAVRTLEDTYAIDLPESATEGECLRLARRTGKAVVGEAFAPIVRAWMALAYARQAPGDFERLATLYARHFEPSGKGGTPS